VLFYFITFTPKCFVLAVTAISAKLRAIMLNKTCKTLQFLCRFVNSAHGSQICAKFCVRRIGEFWHPYINLNIQSWVHLQEPLSDCAYDCTQLQYAMQHKTVLLTFLLILQASQLVSAVMVGGLFLWPALRYRTGYQTVW